jgi:hypothetical protein
MTRSTQPNRSASRRIFSGAAIGLAIAASSAGCGTDLLGVKAPEASLNRVDLLQSPSANKLARWGCFEYFDSSWCQAAGLSRIDTDNMHFSIDVVFDLDNPNKSFAIPLVELLLGMTVYPGENQENLGAVCVSFCDPDEATCTPEADAAAACDLSSAKQIDTVSDVVPTVDEMFEIADNVADGDTDSNNAFRVIPKNGSTEAHVQLDLNIDTALSVLSRAIEDAANTYINNGNFKVKMPHSSDGNVFFNVPQAGRYAVGFGPFEDQWKWEL